MGHMPLPQQPIKVADTPPESVIEFGAEPSPRAGRLHRWSPVGLVRELAGDRRAVPIAAVLAAIAGFASLNSEWQLTTVDSAAYDPEGAGSRTLPTEVTDLGALGGAYLTGLFVLTVAIVLTMFGPAAGRRYARLTGLSAGGVVVALLVALATSLHGQSRTISRLFSLELHQDQLHLSYGRGLWCALIAVAAALVALHLAGRHTSAVRASAAVSSPALAPTTAAAVEPEPVWSWRRPRVGADDPIPGQPFDLTVSPATPFTPSAADRDHGTGTGSGRPGISG
jgi:MFS family permease